MTRLPVTNLLMSTAVLAYIAALSYFTPSAWFRTLCLIGGIIYGLLVQSWCDDR